MGRLHPPSSARSCPGWFPPSGGVRGRGGLGYEWRSRFRLDEVRCPTTCPRGAELWSLYLQPGSEHEPQGPQGPPLFPPASFPRQAARSSLWCARNFPMGRLSPTISAALKPKCQSGRGRATPNRVPRREYHSLEPIEGVWAEKPVRWRVKFLPLQRECP